MICENDKLFVAQKYQEMSVVELKKEKEKLYKEICKERNNKIKKTEKKIDNCGIKFYL